MQTPEFKCEKTPANVGPIKVNLVKNAVELTVTGQVVGAKGTGLAGVAVEFSSAPETFSGKVSTDKDGKYAVVDKECAVKEAYTLKVAYKDVKQEEVDQQYTTSTAAKESVEMPAIYFIQEVDAVVSGHVMSGSTPASQPEDVKLDCPSQNITQSTKSGKGGVYQFSFPVQVSYHSKVACKLTTATSESDVTLQAPDFSAKADVQKQEGQQLTIQGQVLDADGKGKQALPLQFATKPDTGAYKTTTDADGKWHVLDKVQLLTHYDLIVTYLGADN